MSPTSATVEARTVHDAALARRGTDRILDSPATVLVACLGGGTAFVADAVAGQAAFGLVGLAVMALALALSLTQAVRTRVGRPWRTTRRAAVAGGAACLFVAAFLSSVGVLERLGPQATSSALFAAGVAVMSVVLLIVLPVSLVVFGWGVSRDARLEGWMRVLPWALLLVVALGAAVVAVTRESVELWLQAAAVAVVGALLTAFSAGVSSAGRGASPPRQPRRSGATSREPDGAA
jgi:hypothetical protein